MDLEPQPQIPQAPETDATLNQTLLTRARLKGVFSRFLLDHPVGKFLVEKDLVKHPVKVEESLRQQKINDLAHTIQKWSGPGYSFQDAYQQAQLEPDFQSKTVEQIILETFVEKVATQKIKAANEDINGHVSFYFNLSPAEQEDQVRQFPEEQRITVLKLFPKVIEDQKYVFLRDRFHSILDQGDMFELMNLIYVNHRDPEMGQLLSVWITGFRHTLFSNAFFRRHLFRKMIIVLMMEGEIMFESFDNFWQEVGFDLSDEKEKRALVKSAFPQEVWDQLLFSDRERYYRALDLLERYGLKP